MNEQPQNTQAQEQPTESPKKRSALREVLSWVQAILLAVIIALLIRGFVFEPVLVDGQSMENTLHDKERLIIFKTGYFFHAPERGDIIVLEYQQGLMKFIPLPDPTEKDYIKRVIGIPGDIVDIKDGAVFINGKQQSETYAKGKTIAANAHYEVPAGKVFVLGDNREHSSDSRVIGFIDFARIKGKATIRLFPFDRAGLLK